MTSTLSAVHFCLGFVCLLACHELELGNLTITYKRPPGRNEDDKQILREDSGGRNRESVTHREHCMKKQEEKQKVWMKKKKNEKTWNLATTNFKERWDSCRRQGESKKASGGKWQTGKKTAVRKQTSGNKQENVKASHATLRMLC